MISWFLIFAAGFLLGWWMCAATWPRSDRRPRDRDPDWRRSFNHENTNRPNGPPPQSSYGSRFDPGSVQRGNGHGGPRTAKPQFSSPRIIREDFLP